MIWTGKVLRRLNEMLDSAIDGNFRESDYNETELSKIEAKWKRFLGASSLAKANLEKEKDNIKSLVSDISHQTKTPVANIKLYGELLEESLRQGSTDIEKQRNMAAEITAQAEKLEFLMQALTKMSRLESNMVCVRPKKQSLGTLLEQTAAQVLPKAEEKGIQVFWDGEDLDTEVCYDLKWTEEALYNILDNAVKYSPGGKQVRSGIMKYAMYCAVYVQDEGPGIREEEIPRIFQRFYRGREVQQKPGVGIGLYLAREIIKKQHGYIRVESKEGKGARFSVILPVNHSQQEENLSELLDLGNDVERIEW